MLGLAVSSAVQSVALWVFGPEWLLVDGLDKT
jgi:hypothetical protein